MLIFGRDCGCDARREYMTENALAFLVLAGLALALVLVTYKGMQGGNT